MAPVLLFLFLCSDEKATSLSWMRVTNTYEKINRAITNHRSTKLDQILFVRCEYLVILSNFDTFQRNKNFNVIRIKKNRVNHLYNSLITYLILNIYKCRTFNYIIISLFCKVYSDKLNIKLYICSIEFKLMASRHFLFIKSHLNILLLRGYFFLSSIFNVYVSRILYFFIIYYFLYRWQSIVTRK